MMPRMPEADQAGWRGQRGERAIVMFEAECEYIDGYILINRNRLMYIYLPGEQMTSTVIET